jgi:hypothetical protein
MISTQYKERKKPAPKPKPIPVANLVPKRIARVARFTNLLKNLDGEAFAIFNKVPLWQQEEFITDFESTYGSIKQLRKSVR